MAKRRKGKKVKLFQLTPMLKSALKSADKAAVAWYIHQANPEISEPKAKMFLDAVELIGDGPFSEGDFDKAVDAIEAVEAKATSREVDRAVERAADLGVLKRRRAGAEGEMLYRVAPEWCYDHLTERGEAARDRATAALAKIVDADGPIGCEQRAAAELIRLRLFDELKKDAPPQRSCPTCGARH